MTGRPMTRPVRVLHVIHHLQPGGMEYGLVKLVNGLVGGPIESLICSTSAADPEMAGLLAPGVRLIELARRAINRALAQAAAGKPQSVADKRIA